MIIAQPEPLAMYRLNELEEPVQNRITENYRVSAKQLFRDPDMSEAMMDCMLKTHWFTRDGAEVYVDYEHSQIKIHDNWGILGWLNCETISSDQ